LAVTLRLYDTVARSVRDFSPLVPGKVGIYLCGATVQEAPHIGHMRSGVNYDVLWRWLAYRGLDVTFIRNVTDIDDKILAKSAEDGEEWWALAYRHELAFAAGYDALGCLRPTYEPRATGHILEMIVLMRQLIERGHAYASGGDVYFDVLSHPEYGVLSGQRVDQMKQPEDSGTGRKRDPRDFALWKGHKQTEPATASWETPWGTGRPGWHLECSAMAGKYLGDAFDIHGGGTDLVFPHHENEITQSRAAGREFANFWVHHALLNLGGEKMSKSVGNTLGVPAVLSRVRAVELRYYLAAPHYRSIIDYSEESLQEAALAYRRVEGFVARATEQVGATERGTLCAEFTAAMDDDLSTPKALAALHDVVREGNQALAAGNDTAARGALGSVRAMLGVLGLDPLDPVWAGTGRTGDLHGVVDSLVAVALEQRQAARARKDYPASDAIRDQLKQAGILVEDTPHGPRWTLSDGNV
jgi:cysteinyl-tRNA synthetase